MLNRLSNSHREMEKSGAHLRAILDRAVLDAEALRQARWDIGTRIMQHLALEDRHLFANLAAHDDPRVRETARAYRVEFAKYMAEYADHAKAWPAERVVAEWDRYRTATRHQLDLLSARIAKVEANLFPLVRTGAIDVAQAPSMSWARHAFAIKDSITGRGRPARR